MRAYTDITGSEEGGETAILGGGGRVAAARLATNTGPAFGSLTVGADFFSPLFLGSFFSSSFLSGAATAGFLSPPLPSRLRSRLWGLLSSESDRLRCCLGGVDDSGASSEGDAGEEAGDSREFDGESVGECTGCGELRRDEFGDAVSTTAGVEEARLMGGGARGDLGGDGLDIVRQVVA